MKGQTAFGIPFVPLIGTLTIMISLLISPAIIKTTIDRELTYTYEYDRAQYSLQTLFSANDGKSSYETITTNYIYNIPTASGIKTSFEKVAGTNNCVSIQQTSVAVVPPPPPPPPPPQPSPGTFSCPMQNPTITCGSLGSGNACEHCSQSYRQVNPGLCDTFPRTATGIDVAGPGGSDSYSATLPTINGKAVQWKYERIEGGASGLGYGKTFTATDGTDTYEIYITHLKNDGLPGAIGESFPSGASAGSLYPNVDGSGRGHTHIQIIKNGVPIKNPETELGLCSSSQGSLLASTEYVATESQGVTCRGSGLVSRSGNSLTLDGKQFKFIGVNIHSLAKASDSEADRILKYLSNSCGVNVVRIWGYQNTFGIGGINNVKKVLDKGTVYNLKFIVTLEDFPYGSAESNPKEWFSNGYKSEFKPYVRNIASSLKDRNEILAWEIMNEPHCKGDESCVDAFKNFVDDISRTIKENDANHLVSIGTMGLNHVGERIDNNEYKNIHSLPNVDLVSGHYSGNDETQKSYMNSGIGIADSINKPFYIGESWFRGNGPAPDGSCTNTDCTNVCGAGELDGRAQKLSSEINVFSPKVDGYLVWQYSPKGNPTLSCDPFSFFDGDPMCNVLKIKSDEICSGVTPVPVPIPTPVCTGPACKQVTCPDGTTSTCTKRYDPFTKNYLDCTPNCKGPGTGGILQKDCPPGQVSFNTVAVLPYNKKSLVDVVEIGTT
ncbi:MAG: cellulase family glycosylhydrolase [Candidatus Aenigmarchaeota archaeon]|nr:cellulase family glycosylhydrolase [Candidatus Aenigmarchaeota archaeon]